MKKTYTVFWSGGLDSTYLIQKLLSEGHAVEACYIELTNNEEQVKREKAAIDKLLPIFQENSDFYYRGVAVTIGINCGFNAILTQGYCWFTSSIVVRDRILALGYVMNDDAISFLEEFRAINTALNGLRQEPVEIEFPLSKTSKSTIIGRINSKLMEHVVWCESASETEKPCGRCTSCKRMKVAYGGDNYWKHGTFADDTKQELKFDPPGVFTREIDSCGMPEPKDEVKTLG